MHQIKQENWFFEKNKGEFHRQNCWWNPFDSNNVTKKNLGSPNRKNAEPAKRSQF
jgi:hypothetical protein